MSSRVLAQIAFTALMLAACSRAKCTRYTDDLREDVVSPDRSHKAVIFRRTCEGENPMYATVHVCISAASGSAVLDADTVFTTNGDMTVTARWIDASHLRIVYGRAPVEDGSTVALQKQSHDSIAIEYSHIE